MDFDLSDDHQLIRSTVREFAEGEIAPVAEELDREKRFPYAIVEQLGELGLMGIPFPEEYGGAGGDSLAYAKDRIAFGQPISKYQAIQGKLADLSTEIEAARLLTYKAAFLKDQDRNFTLTAAQAKLKTGRLAVRATEEAVQIHGGYGYIEEYPVCRYYRDAKILTIGEGTDEVMQMVIARALGA